MRQLFEIQCCFVFILSCLMVESLWLFASVALNEVIYFYFLPPRDTIHSPVYLAVPLPGRIRKAVTGVWVMFCLFTL